MDDAHLQKLEEKIYDTPDTKYSFFYTKKIKPNWFHIIGAVLGFLFGLALIFWAGMDLAHLPNRDLVIQNYAYSIRGSFIGRIAGGLIMLPVGFALFGALLGELVEEIIKKYNDGKK